uniref:Peptidase S8/S53 domain-containing protein n=1 Tax=uncultured bacterium A1Q1_fos_1880 TaxID=1256556 RepID=L7VVH6_9BACT|nr:hypothetical protein [uncultured bacterium A1Q1_fos_1880]
MPYQAPLIVSPPPPLEQYDQPDGAFLIEASAFLRVGQARQSFGVSGKGLAAAVIDTGLNSRHVDFAGRVPVQRNFTADNNDNPDDATDGQGHGTNVAGIIAANGDHFGMAPDANVIPLKTLPNIGSGSFQAIANALEWVVQQHNVYNISVVCMSLSDSQNYTEDDFHQDSVHNKIHETIRALRALRVPVVIAAGNEYYTHGSQQGMGYPAILRESVSVGAVYDSDGKDPYRYANGAVATTTKAGQITPFSQRLHPSVNSTTYTDIFAPGAPITSSGILNEHGESTDHGTSQAAPVTAGIIILMQELYMRNTGELPEVDTLVQWLRRDGVTIFDGDDGKDNVKHTNLNYIRLDAINALQAVAQDSKARSQSAPTLPM